MEPNLIWTLKLPPNSTREILAEIRRQAVEPAIGRLKSDNRMDRCWLKGSLGDALHAVLCAAGYNLRWLMRAMLRLGLKAVFLRSLWLTMFAFVISEKRQTDSIWPKFQPVGG